MTKFFGRKDPSPYVEISFRDLWKSCRDLYAFLRDEIRISKKMRQVENPAVREVLFLRIQLEEAQNRQADILANSSAEMIPDWQQLTIHIHELQSEIGKRQHALLK